VGHAAATGMFDVFLLGSSRQPNTNKPQRHHPRTAATTGLDQLFASLLMTVFAAALKRMTATWPACNMRACVGSKLACAWVSGAFPTKAGMQRSICQWSS
jgi:hypothetical protein